MDRIEGLSAKRTTLKAQPVFCARTAEELGQAAEQRLGARVLHLSHASTTGSTGHRYPLSGSELWFCSYANRTALRFSGGDYVRLQVPRSGQALTTTRKQGVPVAGSLACISSAEADIEFSAGFQQLAWRIERRRLVRKLAAITGLPCARPLEFEASLDLASAPASAVLPLVSALLDCADSLPGAARDLVTHELEESLMVALLVGASHSLRPLLDRPVGRAPSWQVRRVEEHIEAHCDQPLRLEDLVAVAGSSARSLFRSFRESRGYTPMQFLLRCRLERARRELADAAGRRSITEVALSCGFASVSHFSRAFSAAYGEAPSAFTRRRD